MKKVICYILASFQFLVGIANLFLGWTMIPPDYGRISFGTIIFITGFIWIFNGLVSE